MKTPLTETTEGEAHGGEPFAPAMRRLRQRLLTVMSSPMNRKIPDCLVDGNVALRARALA